LVGLQFLEIAFGAIREDFHRQHVFWRRQVNSESNAFAGITRIIAEWEKRRRRIAFGWGEQFYCLIEPILRHPELFGDLVGDLLNFGSVAEEDGVDVA
jgi:hypothetical protein